MPDHRVTIVIPDHIARHPHGHAHEIVDLVMDALAEAGRHTAAEADFGDHSDEHYAGTGNSEPIAIAIERGSVILHYPGGATGKLPVDTYVDDDYIDPGFSDPRDPVAGRRRLGIGPQSVG